MLGRLFGRSKDENDDTICSACGRTLLAGEWTQRVVEDDGSERFICALCARADAAPGLLVRAGRRHRHRDPRPRASRRAPTATPSGAPSKTKTPRSSVSRACSRAPRPKRRSSPRSSRGLRGESRHGRPGDGADDGRAEPAGAATGDRRRSDVVAGVPAAAPEAGADTAEFKAAEVGSETAERPAAADRGSATPSSDADPSLGAAFGAPPTGRRRPRASPLDETAVLGGGALATRRAAPTRRALPTGSRCRRRTPRRRGAGGATRSATPTRSASCWSARAARPGRAPAADRGGGELVPLTILQRGVDLLNVSAVPKRVVETNENLGIPQVHVGSENESTLLITFMWSMGWYQFRVELEGAGRITLADRGYEERVDLRPNASARTDGTVQLALEPIKPPTPKDTTDARTTGVTRGVIISKSMKGQRTDDENVPADWKRKRAPDFDWGR